jgi:hypothetical protein
MILIWLWVELGALAIWSFGLEEIECCLCNSLMNGLVQFDRQASRGLLEIALERSEFFFFK